MTASVSMSDRPFGCPPDTILDLPIPPSVNEIRRINYAAMPKLKAWKETADKIIMANGQYKKAWRNIRRYELTIILNEAMCRLDPDNTNKVAIDYLRRIEVITNDSKKFCRGFHVIWGEAPEGMRLVVTPLEDVPNANERRRAQPNARKQASAKTPKKVAA